jgi:putative molybdopterin biosynthesis protein
MNGPEWLSVAGACRQLKVSRMTLFRLIDHGELPAYRFGRMIRLRAADVEAFARSRSDGGEGDQG